MILGERLRTVREQKELSQGDVEKRSGLLRCYISREKNGHTVPAVDRKSTRLNSSHSQISYAVFCLKEHRKRRNLAQRGQDLLREMLDAFMIAFFQFARDITASWAKTQDIPIGTYLRFAEAQMMMGS